MIKGPSWVSETMAAVLRAELFMLYLCGVWQGEEGAAEDGWGSGERSKDESGCRARKTTRTLQPLPVNRKSRATDSETGGKGKAGGERQQLLLNQGKENTCDSTKHQPLKHRGPPSR